VFTRLLTDNIMKLSSKNLQDISQSEEFFVEAKVFEGQQNSSQSKEIMVSAGYPPRPPSRVDQLKLICSGIKRPHPKSVELSDTMIHPSHVVEGGRKFFNQRYRIFIECWCLGTNLASCAIWEDPLNVVMTGLKLGVTPIHDVVDYPPSVVGAFAGQKSDQLVFVRYIDDQN